MRRVGVWLVAFLAAAGAAVMAAKPDGSGRAPAVTSTAPARHAERPRDMAAAIALLDQIQP